MPPFFCNMCNTIVQAGDRHSCFFYKDNEIAYDVRQPYETEKVDIKFGQRIGEHAGSLQQNNGNSCEAAQQIRNASQASTSNVENKEIAGGSIEDSKVLEHRPFAQEPSFQSADNMEILDAEANQPLESGKDANTVPGPSTIRHQTIGPDGKILYACDQCSYQCKNKSDFRKHYTTHTGEKNHVCDTCGKSFSRKDALNQHARIHTGEKPFVCKKCDKGFAQKGNLDLHLTRHTGEKKHVCGFCEKRFAGKGDLKRHKRTHTGEKPYVCEKYDKDYAGKEHLNKHLRTHTEERPFKCPIIERTISDQSDLGSHVETPYRGPYRCGRCAQTFSSNEDRNRHIMQEHGRE